MPRVSVRPAAALLAAAALTPALGGCGDSAYSKRDFLARANAICASSLRRSRTIAPPTGTDPAALAAYLDGVLPVLRNEASELAGLRRPPGSIAERATLADFLRALDASVSEYAALAGAARRGDGAGVARGEAALRGSPVASLGRRYGLTACVAPSSTAA